MRIENRPALVDNLTVIPLEKTANHGNCNVKRATLDNNILSSSLIYVNDKYLSTYFFFVRMFKRSAIILKNLFSPRDRKVVMNIFVKDSLIYSQSLWKDDKTPG